MFLLLKLTKKKPFYSLKKLFLISTHPPGSWDNLWNVFLLSSLWKKIYYHASIIKIRLNKSLSVLLKSKNSLRWSFHLFFKPSLWIEIKIACPVKCLIFPIGQFSLPSLRFSFEMWKRRWEKQELPSHTTSEAFHPWRCFKTKTSL